MPQTSPVVSWLTCYCFVSCDLGPVRGTFNLLLRQPETKGSRLGSALLMSGLPPSVAPRLGPGSASSGWSAQAGLGVTPRGLRSPASSSPSPQPGPRSGPSAHLRLRAASKAPLPPAPGPQRLRQRASSWEAGPVAHIFLNSSTAELKMTPG